jgi:hypothetical protein
MVSHAGVADPLRRLDGHARMGPVRLPGTMWLDSYQRRDEAETAEQRTIKLAPAAWLSGVDAMAEFFPEQPNLYPSRRTGDRWW